MADKLTPITRLEGIIAGQDITPITRLEHFLKQYAGGGGSGGGSPLIATFTSVDGKTGLDKTAKEIHDAFQTSGVIVKVDYGEYGDACYSVASVMAMQGQFSMAVMSDNNENFTPMFFVAATENDYPYEYVPD